MGLQLKTAANADAVSLLEVKRWCGVASDTATFDDLLADLIAMATREVEELAGMALIAQTWTLTLDAFADAIDLPRGPVTAVSAFTYRDVAGTTQTVSAGLWTLDTVSDMQRITRNSGAAWPAVYDAPNVVSIDFVAGFANAAAVPAPLRTAIKIAVAARFEDRTAALPASALALLEPWRAGWCAA